MRHGHRRPTPRHARGRGDGRQRGAEPRRRGRAQVQAPLRFRAEVRAALRNGELFVAPGCQESRCLTLLMAVKAAVWA